ncbi:MerR family transcriptional regulator [Bacillus sp. FJAT-28004]|uniref:MerR family transcriptional regulator n=1 Tax=Bacillus sp. FJAT-28004 TaxID=1679165 RepID=UPI0006B64A67|nr:MerR family transcriptional regulator [Bacillus sp. FJAT-28004]
MNHSSSYAIGAFAKLTKVTERTLRYYDRKGLLKPSSRNTHGHRFYTDQDLIQLQKILTLKYLDFSLEDISAYLQRPEEDLQHSLASQYEMLQRKQEHLERVLSTIGRMQKIVEGAGKVDSDSLLVFIHNIQHEQQQKEWLSSQMPPTFVDAIFLEGMDPESRLDIERRITAYVIELKELYKQGKQPLDEEVLEIGRKLVAFLEDLLAPILSGFNEEELAQLDAINDPSLTFDPVLFPNLFTKDEEAFLAITFDHLEALKSIKGEINGEK